MKSRVVAKVVLMAAFMLPVQSFAALNNDEVRSQHIKDADGTSGQSTSSGSGIKTNHIQDGAVTAAKLGIVCPDGQYLKYTVGSGWACNVGTPGPQGIQGPVGAQGIQGPAGPQGPKGDKGDTGLTGPIGPQGVKGDTGAQGPIGFTGLEGPQGPKGDKGDQGIQGIQGLQGDTGPTGPQGLKGDAGLQGPIGLTGPEGPQGPKGDKGDIGPIGPTGLKGDTGATGAQGPVGPAPHYSNVIVVAKSGGDFTDIAAAVNSIALPHNSNRYVVKIMPGTYNVTTPITLKPFVELVGSGSSSVVINSSANVIIEAAEQTTISGVAITSLFVSDVVGINANGPVVIKDVLLDIRESMNATGIQLNNCKWTTQGVDWRKPVFTDVWMRVMASNNAYGIKAYSSNVDVINSYIETSSNGANNGNGACLYGTTITGESDYSTGSWFKFVDTKVSGIRAQKATFDARNTLVIGGQVYLDSSSVGNLDNVETYGAYLLNASSLYVKNSKMHGGPNGAITNNYNCRVEVKGSYIDGPLQAIAPMAIINTQIYQGYVTPLSNLTCIGVYDMNYNPVTCQ